uniref:Uncharacterized protein n=1 Tax=Photorhabdus asymbiotica TaxID=291112 RepID=D8MBZ7_9GAMM|nr:hypothetical protein pPAA3_0008 [Photorhabdus asymbiotica]
MQIIFEGLSKNTESIISLIIALSVMELFYREGFYVLSSKLVRDVDDYRKMLIRQHLNLPSEAKITIQRGKRNLEEGK